VNNTAPRVYGGDLYGNVWRFDIDRLTSSGTGTTTVQLLATLSDASGNRQPITSRPELGLVNSLPVVFVGTGELLGVSDLSTTSVQSLYAIKDTLAIPSTSPATTAIYASPRSSACGTSTTNCFVRQTLTNGSGVRTATTNSVNFTTQSGWFIDWPTSGERVSTDPNLQLGTLVVTSNIPSSSGSACSVAGTSYTNYFNYGTGSAVPGASNVGALNSSLASTPTLVRTTSGAVKAIINLADASQTTQSIPISASSRPTRRISWRELIDGR
jgi:type IV pilus assembly protein PilY1